MTRWHGLAIGSVLAFLPAVGMAQQDRISGNIDRYRTVVLKGNVQPNARSEFDQGRLDPTQKLTLITLMLKPSASQQAALDRLLAGQQDPFSSNYHKWLTPEEYADRFGLSRGDIAKIVAWLQSEGFHVDDVARGRNSIVFSGTVAQVNVAFRTEIHRYLEEGESHFANATEPSVPAALQPVVIGIRGLDDFHPKPAASRREPLAMQAPHFTNNAGNNYLAPDDLAIIYDLVPVYQAGYDGSGQTLVVAGQTNVNIQDIQTFRQTFGLSNNLPQLMKVPSSVDPGITGDLGEADLDLEWSGAVARNAKIIFVYSTDVFTSVQYAINQNLAPVISFSYGACELGFSGTDAQNAQAVAQQANAQGITWVVSSDDSGAAGCDRQGQNPLAQKGVATNIFASIPEVTGVGGTMFNEGGGTYWNASNTATGASALGYIPEVAWNESGQNGLGASGGGYSIFYPQPSWQTGPGVTTTNARAVPDVSLTAALHDGYIIVTNGQATPTGGTSAAAPSFAGMITLLNQYQVAQGFQATAGQGNLNPNLYRMAQSTTNVFHDVVEGNNVVPCAQGTLDCSTGSYGYYAGPGYDPVTGLGSVDANNLIANWNSQVVSTPPLWRRTHPASARTAARR
jgi:subtilase family serine protease